MSEPAELTLFTALHPIAVLTDREEFDKFYADIKKAVAEFVPDTTTQKGRDAIKALAFKVTKTKTFLDQAGKSLTEEKRHEIALVDESRRNMRFKLEALKDEVRYPLDKWEAEEYARVELLERDLATLKAWATVSADQTGETLAARFDKIQATEIDPEIFKERTEEAKELRRLALEAIEAGIRRVEKEEADRAELARLRAENEARDREAERQERERFEAGQRQLAEEAEAERKERIAAEQKAREERAAQVASEARERQLEEKHQAELRQEREARERLEREEAGRRAEAKRLEDEQIKRDLDRIHRRKVSVAARDAIMEVAKTTEEQARGIVLAIIAGEIPNVSLRF